MVLGKCRVKALRWRGVQAGRTITIILSVTLKLSKYFIYIHVQIIKIYKAIIHMMYVYDQYDLVQICNPHIWY